jgi:hypothetical protein
MIRSLCALLLAAAFAPAAARADAAGDLAAVMSNFAAAKSYHVTEALPGGRTVTIDYVAPDRWRISPTPNITELLIGNDVYMVRNGKTTHLPIPGGMLRATIDQLKGSLPSDVKSTARDLGMQTLDGQAVHVYSYTSHGATVTLFVGSNHLPVRNVVKASNGTTTITYSQYNAPISIEP